MNKYSFILPAYKKRFLKEALDSILCQTYADFELIIVNDASPEDLDTIVKQYEDPRIRYYVNKDNIGATNLVAQWNHCLEYAKGEYVILASDDDVYFPLYLEKIDRLVNKYPEVDLFRPRIQIIDEKNRVKRVYDHICEKMSSFEFTYNLHLDNIGSAIGFYVFNRKALLKNGGFINFPMAWASDDATAILMSRNGIVFEKDVLFSFRMSGENISTTYDYNTVNLKIGASNLYYEFVKSYLKAYKRESLSPNDIYYYDYIEKDLKSLIQRNTRFLIDKLPIRYALKCILGIIKYEWATPLFIIKRAYRQILKFLSLA